MVTAVGKGVVDLAGSINKANKIQEPITPKQFNSGSAKDVAKFNQLMGQPQGTQNISRLSELGKSGQMRIGGSQLSPQTYPTRTAPGDMILNGIQKMRSNYKGQVSEIMDTVKSAKSKTGGLDPTEMVKVNYAMMTMQTWTGEITSIESNLKGTMQQLMSAQ